MSWELNRDGERRRMTAEYIKMLEKIEKKVNLIHLILTGNGDYEKGVLSRVDKNTSNRLFLEKWAWLLVMFITSVPFTVVGGYIVWVLRSM